MLLQICWSGEWAVQVHVANLITKKIWTLWLWKDESAKQANKPTTPTEASQNVQDPIEPLLLCRDSNEGGVSSLTNSELFLINHNASFYTMRTQLALVPMLFISLPIWSHHQLIKQPKSFENLCMRGFEASVCFQNWFSYLKSKFLWHEMR